MALWGEDNVYLFLKSCNILFKKHNSLTIKNCKLFFCVSLRYEMSGKLHLICMKTEFCMKTFGFHAKIRCNLNDISTEK